MRGFAIATGELCAVEIAPVLILRGGGSPEPAIHEALDPQSADPDRERQSTRRLEHLGLPWNSPSAPHRVVRPSRTSEKS
jgi:hypothetical protein